jgi:hypothetical protein
LRAGEVVEKSVDGERSSGLKASGQIAGTLLIRNNAGVGHCAAQGTHKISSGLSGRMELRMRRLDCIPM